MPRFICLLILLLSASSLCAQERERSLVVDVGNSSSNSARGHGELDIYRIGMQWSWKRTLWQGQNADLGGYYEASLNRWDGSSDSVTAIAFSPVFRLQFGDRNRQYRPYVEAGIGFALLSDDHAAGRQMGSSWQFEDRIGFGFKSDRYDFHYRYMHYSNGDIEEPNQGLDAHVLGMAFRF